MTPLDPAALRVAFDDAFRQALVAAPERVALVAVWAGPFRVALPVETLAGIERAPRLTRVPTSDARLAGIAPFRGHVVPVWSLAAWLGGADGEGPVHWAAFARDGGHAVSFDALEGQLLVAREQVVALPEATAGALCRELVVDGATRWWVGDLGVLGVPSNGRPGRRR